jgi:hypothetical protein
MEPIIKLAERSMGAALAAASIAGSRRPPKIDTGKTAGLRNRAVHAGHYPNDGEVEDLLFEVERIILESEAMLSTVTSVNVEPYWPKVIGEDIADSLARNGWAGLPGIQRSCGTILASNRPPNRSSITLDKTIANYGQDIADDETHWRVW